MSWSALGFAFGLVPRWVWAGLLALLAAGLTVQTLRIKAYEANLAHRDAMIQSMRLGLERWSDEATRVSEETASALAKAQEQSKAHQTRASALHARILAAQHNTCGPAIQEIRDALGR